jgi:TetR/AcrR family transcriptional regulator, regulator of cefoperazone and chloramphenicol sensitivity
MTIALFYKCSLFQKLSNNLSSFLARNWTFVGLFCLAMSATKWIVGGLKQPFDSNDCLNYIPPPHEVERNQIMSGRSENTDSLNTRERLLLAALKSFGHNDFDAVSTREIVEIAGANISAISYHFGGKRGLYLATAEYMAERMQAKMKPLMESIRSQLVYSDKDGCQELLKQLIHGFVHNLLMGEVSEDAAGLIFREQNHPTDAFDFLYDKFMLPMQTIYSMLVARITGADPDAKETMLITHSLLGQIVIYRMGRETILRRLGIKRFSADDVNQIAELISALSLKALNGESYQVNQNDL